MSNHRITKTETSPGKFTYTAHFADGATKTLRKNSKLNKSVAQVYKAGDKGFMALLETRPGSTNKYLLPDHVATVQIEEN